MMLKTTALLLCLLTLTFATLGQLRTFADLKGRWITQKNVIDNDKFQYIFINDSLAVIKDVEGRFKDVVKFSTDFQDNAVWITYSIAGATSANKTKILILPNNDKTIDIKFAKRLNSSLKDMENITKKYTLTKIDNADYSSLAILPSDADIRGTWTLLFKNKIRGYLKFSNDTATFINNLGYLLTYTYKTDFTKYPVYIDFTSIRTGKVLQGLVTIADSSLYLHTFPNNDRAGGVKIFGNNINYTRKKLNPGILPQ